MIEAIRLRSAMKDNSNVNIGRRRFLRLGIFASVVPFVASGAGASETAEERCYFNVPAGKAAKTLAVAVRQAKVEIILSADLVKGVRTRKVRGRFTPMEAFRRMLSGSQLEIIRHLDSGIYTVRRLGESKSLSETFDGRDAIARTPSEFKI